MRYVANRDMKAVAADLKRIYSGVSAENAELELQIFEETPGKHYRAAVRVWRNARTNVITYFQFPSRDPQDHLHHQRHRIAQRLDAKVHPEPQDLPQRRIGPEIEFPGDSCGPHASAWRAQRACATAIPDPLGRGARAAQWLIFRP